MELDILLKLQQYPDYKECDIVAMPMCSVCKNLNGKKCLVYGKPPKNIQMEHEVCKKVIIDKSSIFYDKYMKLYGYRHNSEK